jgi:tyrosinase
MKGMLIRKNIKSLSSNEKKAFVKAVKMLKANKYNWYPIMHARTMQKNIITDKRNAAHMGPIFLPWHRKFIREFEKDLQIELQKELGSTVRNLGLPYWDWSENSRIWDADFMGGNGDIKNGIVTTGPFRYNPPNGWTCIGIGEHGEIDVDVEGNPKYYPLLRLIGDYPKAVLPTMNDIEECLKVTPYDTPDWDKESNPTKSFRNKLEGWDTDPTKSHMHNVVHRWIGGSMLTMTSPNDPVFFLHHANVDRLWARWQIDHPNESYPPHGTISDFKTGQLLEGYNLKDKIYPWEDGTTIENVLDFRSLGYEYDTYDYIS